MTDPVFQAPGIPNQNLNQESASPVAAPTQQPEQTQVETPTPAVPTAVSQPTPMPQATVSQPQTPQQPETNSVPPVAAVQQPVASENTTQSASTNKLNDLKAKLSGLNLQQIRQKIQSYLWYVLGGCFLLGMMFGCSMGGEETQPAPKKTSGIEKMIVFNKDVQNRSKYRACGLGNLQTDSCFYYVLNSYTYEKRAEDFFKLVQDQVKKDEYYIRQVNPITAQLPIPAGHFAEILVPATK